MKQQMMICPRHKTCKNINCPHNIPHIPLPDSCVVPYCVNAQSAIACEYVVVPGVKPQGVHVIQRIIGDKIITVAARDSRQSARLMHDGLKTFTGGTYRIRPAIIQEGK